MLNNTETTMTYEIESNKGNATVDSIEAAARWIDEMRPAFVSINGETVDYGADDDGDAIAVAIAVALATDERIEALRTEAGAAGDATQVALCDRALAGDDEARAACAEVLADAAAQA